MDLLPETVQLWFAWMVVGATTVAFVGGLAYLIWWVIQRVQKFFSKDESTFDS